MIANIELPEDCGSSPTTSEHVLMPNFRGESGKMIECSVFVCVP